MPRFLQMLLTTWPAAILAYVYVGAKLYDALTALLPFPDQKIMTGLLCVGLFCNFYPPLLLLLYFLEGRPGEDFTRGNRLVDFVLAYPFWIGVILLIEVVPWLLLIDFVKLPLYPIFDQMRSKWYTVQYQVVLAVLGVILLYILVRVIVDSTRVRITRHKLPVSNIPAEMNGLRIVHISDIQRDRRTGQRRLRRYVRKVNRLGPDIVFFSGDVLGSMQEDLPQTASLLGNIRARYGVFACLGDNDIERGRAQVIQALLENRITALHDKNQLVMVRGGRVLITFITNAYNQRPNLDNINFLMGQQPRGDIDIVLTHQPSESVIEMAAERGYHLLLAGHTHGGQVIARPFGLALTPAKMESPFFNGIYVVDQMLVHINNGLGFKSVPLRCRAPAEVSLIEVENLRL